MSSAEKERNYLLKMSSMEYDFDPKLEPPDSPVSQDRLTPEFDVSSTDGACGLYGGNWMGNGDTNSYVNSYDNDADDYAKESIRKLCLVCGDVASGLHYGVASCEACKAFFKRTIQGSIEYSCPASGCCEITRSRRKACQACRFQKCLHMGMLREGVRPDRVRGGRQKYKKTNDSPYVVIRNSKTTTNHHNNNSGSQNSNNIKRQSNNGGDFHPKVKVETTKTYKQSGSKLLQTLKCIEPEKVYAMPDSSQDDDFKFKVTISDLTDRELVAIISWVKQVPDFKGLLLKDQMSLLRSTWLDIVCLNIAYRSLPYDGDIVYADDFKLSEEDASLLGAPVELDNVIRRLIRKLSEVKINYEEYLLLKALLLFNPDVNVADTKLVQLQRDNVLEALLEYEGCHKESTSLPHRVSDLLLVLPLVVHARFATRDFWLMVAADSSIVLHKLLREMLEYVT